MKKKSLTSDNVKKCKMKVQVNIRQFNRPLLTPSVGILFGCTGISSRFDCHDSQMHGFSDAFEHLIRHQIQNSILLPITDSASNLTSNPTYTLTKAKIYQFPNFQACSPLKKDVKFSFPNLGRLFFFTLNLFLFVNLNTNNARR